MLILNSNWVQLDFDVSRSNFIEYQIPKDWKNQIPPNGPMNPMNWYKSLVIANYSWVKIFSLAVLDVKLWLKEEGVLHTDHL